jgi:hypothetical protein
MHAQQWVMKNVRPHSTIEGTPYAPDFSKLKGSTVVHVRGPFVTGRSDLFAPLFSADPEMTQRMEAHEMDEKISWYTCAEFKRRNPEYVAINSLYYSRFIEGPSAEIHPLIQQHFQGLLEEGYPYRVVFDERTPQPGWWLYPKEIDTLENRMTILQRHESETVECQDSGSPTSQLGGIGGREGGSVARTGGVSSQSRR